jgi:AcrR family transcriptional regulator
MSDRADPFAHMDRRARRTRHLLAEALLSLGADDANIDALDIAAIADEAGVSRSTFYQHFASKDDFMIRSFVEMITATEARFAQAYPDRTDLLPSRPLFTHVREAEGLVRAIVRSDYFTPQLTAGELKLREIAEANLARLKPDWPADRRRETAVYVAGGFIGLLRWWMEGGLKQTPERMQAAFEQLSASALNSAV